MKTVLITGANRSIGFETARQLAAQGYYIYLGSRSLESGSEAVAKLQAEGLTTVEPIQIDIADEASIRTAREELSKRTDSLDVLINNAGISGPMPQSTITTETAAIRQVFDTNFFGTINVTQAFLDLLRKSDEPRIVNVTSGLGSLEMQTNPASKFYQVKSAAYGPSKTALNAYTVALAYDLRDTPFKINVVDPGYTATDFNHHSGPGTVEDAAKIIAKYATVGADGPTGQFFSNDADGEGDKMPW
ncbi:SDR family oxidoreductase [Hymenobacter aerilatus]|uniref:SDR family oxidoreductase n=1 Tax=Hymenobacter aerilatus TaxID=2932251 RepID=A0A8T9SYP0_9BACT|nr:SDR family oxidoreductase [Hymenobacter aerilatus]UOR04926.1 SDR family oxidoreductase [Hymenobacter aerilatus]